MPNRRSKLGAFDFVLKPTNTNELENVILKAKDLIIKGNNEIRAQEEIKQMLEASLPMLKDKFVSDLLFSNFYSVDDIKKKMSFFGLHIEGFVLVRLAIDKYSQVSSNFTEEESYLFMLSLIDKTSSLLNRCKLQYIINSNQNIITVIFNFSNNEDEDVIKPCVISIAEELRNKVENHFPFTVSIGISRLYNSIDDLKRAQKEAEACLENRFYIGCNSTIHIDDIPVFESNLGKNSADSAGILDAIRAGNTEKILYESQKIVDILSKCSNRTYLKNICLEIVVSSIRLYNEVYGSIEDIFKDGVIPFEKIINCSTAAELFEMVKSTMEKISLCIGNLRNSQTRKVITKAFEYINSHFNEDISLNDVANHIYMSPWYFSKLFKKESGETFSEFLLKTRIQNAKLFLKNNLELKTYEIAEKVGVSDARYFGQIFRKVTGMTPSEYRESK